MVPRDPSAYRDAHPSRAVLIVEIAESSYEIDREYKASLYARAGIPEYWIVNLVRDALEIHCEPETSPAAHYGWRYRSVETLPSLAMVAPLIAPDRAIAVIDLLP